jgi:hypothetical protein
MTDSEQSSVPGHSQEWYAFLTRELETLDSSHWSGSSHELTRLLRDARQEGFHVGWRLLSSVPSRYLGSTASLPPFVVDFVVAWLGGRQFARGADPTASMGSSVLLTALVESGAVTSGYGRLRDLDEVKVARELSSGLPIEWIAGSSSAGTDTDDGEVDAVVSAPPLGVRPVKTNVSSESGMVTMRDSPPYLVLLESLRRLAPNGQGVIVVANDFLQRPEGVARSLKRFGLHLHAVLALPEGALAPQTTIPVYLALIGREAGEDLFVGQLQEGGANDELLRNLRQRVRGEAAALGRMTTLAEFRSWRALELAEEIAESTRDSNLRPVALKLVATAVSLGTRGVDGGFEEEPNAVYLPLIGTSAAVTAVSDLAIKAQNYAQVVLDPSTALADYVAGFFNSELGRKVRDGALSGYFIPKITKASLAEMVVYLPPLEEQREVSSVHRSIREMDLQLAALEKKLWSEPGKLAEVKVAIGELSTERGFVAWLETLPFPLASILWRYHAAAEPTQRRNHLLNFFEALSEFLLCVLVSAMMSDAAFWELSKNRFIDKGGRPDALRLGQFGTWVTFGRRIAAVVREMLTSPEERAKALALFRARSDTLPVGVSDPRLYEMLATLNRYRNDWKGHAGVEGNKEVQQRLAVLEGELTRFHEIFSHVFDGWKLLRARDSRLRDGVYYFQADELMGTRTTFREIQVRVVEPMDEDVLYFLETGTLQPLKVLPLFRVMPSPRTEANACYFYNRLNEHDARFISYHFENESEIVIPDAQLVGTLRALGLKV